VEPLAAALLWAGVFTAVKLGLQEIPAPTFMAGRLLLAGAILILLAGRFPWRRLDGAGWRSLAAAGLAQATFQILLIEGIHRTSATISALLLATAPLLTAAWLTATRQERLIPRQWLGLFLGLVGVALVVGADGLDARGVTLVGNLVAFGAAAAWCWYGLAIDPVVRRLGPIRATTGSIGIAALVLTPVGLPGAILVDWAHVSPGAWAGLLYGAVLGLVLATALWVRSVERWGTQATMNYGYVEPVAAVAIAAVALGEALLPMQGVGALLALGGVYLACGPASNASS
jgi:drug/metabolite transporter (DMT)-like permease